MAHLLLLTNTLAPSAEVVPALGLLSHHVRILPAEASALVDAPSADVVIVDARRELAMAKSLCRVICTTGISIPLLVVVTEGGLAGITSDWGIDDVLLDTAGPAEVEARLRLAMGRQQIVNDDSPMEIRNGDLSVDEATYSAKLKGRVLDLTFKEFELLKYLAQHPGRVFTRAQLLQEVWGYDYFGGTRTVDVHVRRLRAKLGPEHESLIGTVRNVGYRFVTPEKGGAAASEEAKAKAAASDAVSQAKTDEVDDSAALDASEVPAEA
jgi:DNA-binding response OmpR family regulator